MVESGVIGLYRVKSRSFRGLCEDRASRSNLAVARQRDPRGHRSARQCRGFLKGQVARHVNERLLAQHTYSASIPSRLAPSRSVR
jgi:hypothetical protein